MCVYIYNEEHTQKTSQSKNPHQPYGKWSISKGEIPCSWLPKKELMQAVQVSDDEADVRAWILGLSSTDLGKFHHDLTVLPKPKKIMVYFREIIPIAGRKIQVSEI